MALFGELLFGEGIFGGINEGGIEYVELRRASDGVVLPHYISLTLDTKYNDLGVLEFSYPKDLAAELDLKDQSVVTAWAGVQGVGAVYVDTYVLGATGGAQVSDGEAVVNFSGNSSLDLLNDAVVYPSNWPSTAPAGHEFIEQSIGNIFRTLILRAKNRGALPSLDETTFTGTTDSNGAAWSHLHSQTWSGDKYYEVLKEFMERGLVDAWVDKDFKLRMVNGGTRGTHVPLDTLEFRPAKNTSDIDVSTQSTEAASVVLIEGEEGTSVERRNAAFEAVLGRRRERFVSQGGIGDAGILALLGDAELELYARIPAEETFGIANGGGISPFHVFNVGDWVWVRHKTDEAPVERRVRQLAISVSETREITVGATLGTIILESDVALARKVESYIGGGGSYGSVPNTQVDNTIPNPPHTLAVTSGAYTTPSGTTAAAFSATWLAPTTNEGGSAYTDADGFILNWRYTTETQWRGETKITEGLAFHYSPATPGADIEVKVCAVDKTGHRSTFVTKTVTLALDATPPGKPAAPTATSRMGSVQVFWNGLLATAGPQPLDFSHAEIHDLPNNTTIPLPGAATKVASLKAAGNVVLSSLTYNSNHYFRVITYDTSGNASPASDPSTVVQIKALVDADLIGRVIDGVHLLYDSVAGDVVKTGTLFTRHLAIADFANYVSDYTFEGLPTWFAVPIKPVDAATLPMAITPDGTATPRPGSPNLNVLRFRTNFMGGSNNRTATESGYMSVSAGQQYRIDVDFRRSEAGVLQSVGNFELRFYYYDKDKSPGAPNPDGVTRTYYASKTLLLSTLTDTTWRKEFLEATVPANAAYARPQIVVHSADTSTAGIYDADEFSCRRKNGGELIVDGTVLARHIKALNIETAHLAANAVTTPKLSVGAVTADRMHVSTQGFAVNVNSNFELTEFDAAGAPISPTTLVGWTTIGGTATRDTTTPLTGAASAKFSLPATTDGRFVYKPHAADLTKYIAVLPGERWFVSVRAKCVGGTHIGGTFPSGVGLVTSGGSVVPISGNAGATEQLLGWKVFANGEEATLSGFITVPAGHVRMGMSFYGGQRDAAHYYLIDDFVAHPAVDDSQITDITPGKIETGVLKASTRMIAGVDGAARTEVAGVGVRGYNSSNALTFNLNATDGSLFASGTLTTGAGGAAGQVTISSYANPYESNSVWNTIQFFSNNVAWTPGLIWAAYGTDFGVTNWGVLQLAGPRLGTRAPARLNLRSEDTTNLTLIEILTDKFSAVADTFTWGSNANGVVTHRLAYAGADSNQRFTFQSAGGKRIEFRYGTAGTNAVFSQNESAAFNKMLLQASDFEINATAASGSIDIGPSAGDNDRIALRSFSANSSIVFAATGVIRFKTWNGSNYTEVMALKFTPSSDIRLKNSLVTVTPEAALEAVNAVPVYDYTYRDGGPSGRGLIAQELLPVLPEAVTGGTEDTPECPDYMGVDMYYLIGTLWASVQKLTQEVETLRARGA